MALKDLLTSASTHAQLVRYTVAAGVGLVADFGSVIVFKEVVNLHYLTSVILGFLIGLAVTYFLSNRFVFGQPKGDTRKAFLLFGLIGLVGLGILSLLVWLLTDVLGVYYLLSKVLATGVVFLWNFFARKTLYDPQEIDLPYEL